MTHHQPGHDHQPAHGEPGHVHGRVAPSIIRSKAGVRAVSLSFGVLLVTALVQLAVFAGSHSVALLADTIHNAGDSLTAIPLALAFWLRSGKGERWSGYFIVVLIAASAGLALYEVINRFFRPQAPSHLLAILAAGIMGVVGNEIAAVIRWRAGRRLDSPALIADGNHARADGIVSAGVIISSLLLAFGFQAADPIIGLLITLLIIKSSWDSFRTMKS